jgi:large subunit ribosomal protein L9
MGKLYGSITTGQIADEMNEALGTEIDRRKVGTEPLRQLGEHKVVVRLSGDFQPELTVMVQPEGRPPIAPARPSAEPMGDEETEVEEAEETEEAVETA